MAAHHCPDPLPRSARLTASAVLLTMALLAGALVLRDRSAPELLSGTSLLIDLNAADTATLELLPRIGPALARRIAEDRAARGPYRSVEDLDRVPGIGKRTIELLRPHVTIGRQSENSGDPNRPSSCTPPSTRSRRRP